MVVVFDEETARGKAARFQKKKHNFDIVFKVSSLVGIGAGGLLLLELQFNFISWLRLVFLVLMLMGLIVQRWAVEVYRAVPEPIVAYWMAIQGKKVLEVKATERSSGDGWAVCVVTEDTDGAVGTSLVGILEQKESTRVREVTVDLNEEVVYVPYKKREVALGG